MWLDLSMSPRLPAMISSSGSAINNNNNSFASSYISMCKTRTAFMSTICIAETFKSYIAVILITISGHSSYKTQRDLLIWPSHKNPNPPNQCTANHQLISRPVG